VIILRKCDDTDEYRVRMWKYDHAGWGVSVFEMPGYD
jgi:hypothetical protein